MTEQEMRESKLPTLDECRAYITEIWSGYMLNEADYEIVDDVYKFIAFKLREGSED